MMEGMIAVDPSVCERTAGLLAHTYDFLEELGAAASLKDEKELEQRMTDALQEFTDRVYDVYGSGESMRIDRDYYRFAIDVIQTAMGIKPDPNLN